MKAATLARLAFNRTYNHLAEELDLNTGRDLTKPIAFFGLVNERCNVSQVVSYGNLTAWNFNHSSSDQTWSVKPAAIAGERSSQGPSRARSVRTGQQKL